GAHPPARQAPRRAPRPGPAEPLHDGGLVGPVPPAEPAGGARGPRAAAPRPARPQEEEDRMTLSPASFQLSIARGVAEITLSRPDRLNALTFEVYNELAATLRSLERVREARAVMITGKGRGFCSGGDVEGIIAELFSRNARALLDFTRVTGALI